MLIKVITLSQLVIIIRLKKIMCFNMNPIIGPLRVKVTVNGMHDSGPRSWSSLCTAEQQVLIRQEEALKKVIKAEFIFLCVFSYKTGCQDFLYTIDENL